MYNNNNGANQNGRSSQYSGGNNGYNSASAPSRAMTLPENYVDEAEKIIYQYMRDFDNKQDKPISNSKIRRMYSLITDIYNNENLSENENLSSESQTMLNMARIRIAYEVGRDLSNLKKPSPDPTKYPIKKFVTDTHIIEYIKGIGTSREQFINFSRYMEALIAYHKFYGGKEN